MSTSSEDLRIRQRELLRLPDMLQMGGNLVPAIEENVAEVDPEPPFADGYGHLARKLYVAYHKSAQALLRPGEAGDVTGENVVGGFDVMTRLMSFAPAAYVSYCRANSLPINLDHLTTILKNSYETAHFLMNMDASRNNLYEDVLSLRGGQAERPTGLFEIVNTDAGERFVAVEARLQEAERRLHAIETKTGQPHIAGIYEKCPAAGPFGLNFWRHAVDLAAADPALFAADLEVAQQT